MQAGGPPGMTSFAMEGDSMPAYRMRPGGTAIPATKPPSKPRKRIYFFANSKAEGRAEQRMLLGGKGANLHDMTRCDLPVPPGFTITTQTCADYYQAGGKLPAGLMGQVRKSLARLEKVTGKRFGHPDGPLLVSVRSGAAVSMPGMMDTILNLGLNDATAQGLARLTGNERFAYDSYRRLIQMFGDVVMGISRDDFDAEMSAVKRSAGVEDDAHLPPADLKDLVRRYKQVYRRSVGADWPQDPLEQLERAIEAVFKSWNTARAVRYRQINKIDGLLGTAVNVQAMVFGNLGGDSGTGVAFTRDPSTGENRFYGEFLLNAQGEDLVAGLRTPLPISEMRRKLPKSYRELLKIKDLLERRYKDVQDFEFTIEQNKLYMLQTRTGKRSAQAAVRIAVEMVKEKLIDRETALLRVDPAALEQLLQPAFAPAAKKEMIALGLPASPGAAVGRLAFSAGEAEERAKAGEKIILVRPETDPADIAGIHVAEGVLTSTGGMTSHAAVVARGMGKPCVVGAAELKIDQKNRMLGIAGRTFGPKDWLSIDGGKGEVYAGQVPLVPAELSGPFRTFMRWAGEFPAGRGAADNGDAAPHLLIARLAAAQAAIRKLASKVDRKGAKRA
jgi:pyruvate,orthophosphate dikinase